MTEKEYKNNYNTELIEENDTVTKYRIISKNLPIELIISRINDALFVNVNCTGVKKYNVILSEDKMTEILNQYSKLFKDFDRVIGEIEDESKLKKQEIIRL